MVNYWILLQVKYMRTTQNIKDLKGKKEKPEKVKDLVINLLEQVESNRNRLILLKGKPTELKFKKAQDMIVLSYSQFIKEAINMNQNGIPITGMVDLYTALRLIFKEIWELDALAKKNNINFDKRQVLERMIECEKGLIIVFSRIDTNRETDSKMYR